MYNKYLLKYKAGKPVGVPLDTPTTFWKKQCIERSVDFRNNRAFDKLHKIDPFTLLPANIGPNLEQMGVKFTLAFLDRRGTHHYLRHDNCFYHRMSATARWFNFGALPAVSRLQKLKVLALNPVFYNEKGNAIRNSPCQRSLLYETEFEWSDIIKQDSLGSDSAIDIFPLTEGAVIAVWKDGGGLAYIAANFHYNNLIQRCLHSTFKERHSSRNSVVLNSRSDPRYTLIGASATVELRNQRQSIWSQQFRSLNVGERGLYAIQPERQQDHTSLDKPIELPWKTELFKNKTPNVCILDICLRGDQGIILWAVSDFVPCVSSDAAKVSYDYEGGSQIIRYTGSGRCVSIVIDRDSDSEKQVISSLSFTTSLVT